MIQIFSADGTGPIEGSTRGPRGPKNLRRAKKFYTGAARGALTNMRYGVIIDQSYQPYLIITIHVSIAKQNHCISAKALTLAQSLSLRTD